MASRPSRPSTAPPSEATPSRRFLTSKHRQEISEAKAERTLIADAERTMITEAVFTDSELQKGEQFVKEGLLLHFGAHAECLDDTTYDTTGRYHLHPNGLMKPKALTVEEEEDLAQDDRSVNNHKANPNAQGVHAGDRKIKGVDAGDSRKVNAASRASSSSSSSRAALPALPCAVLPSSSSKWCPKPQVTSVDPPAGLLTSIISIQGSHLSAITALSGGHHTVKVTVASHACELLHVSPRLLIVRPPPKQKFLLGVQLSLHIEVSNCGETASTAVPYRFLDLKDYIPTPAHGVLHTLASTLKYCFKSGFKVEAPACLTASDDFLALVSAQAEKANEVREKAGVCEEANRAGRKEGSNVIHNSGNAYTPCRCCLRNVHAKVVDLTDSAAERKKRADRAQARQTRLDNAPAKFRGAAQGVRSNIRISGAPGGSRFFKSDVAEDFQTQIVDGKGEGSEAFNSAKKSQHRIAARRTAVVDVVRGGAEDEAPCHQTPQAVKDVVPMHRCFVHTGKLVTSESYRGPASPAVVETRWSCCEMLLSDDGWQDPGGCKELQLPHEQIQSNADLAARAADPSRASDFLEADEQDSAGREPVLAHSLTYTDILVRYVLPVCEGDLERANFMIHITFGIPLKTCQAFSLVRVDTKFKFPVAGNTSSLATVFAHRSANANAASSDRTIHSILFEDGRFYGRTFDGGMPSSHLSGCAPLSHKPTHRPDEVEAGVTVAALQQSRKRSHISKEQVVVTGVWRDDCSHCTQCENGVEKVVRDYVWGTEWGTGGGGGAGGASRSSRISSSSSSPSPPKPRPKTNAEMRAAAAAAASATSHPPKPLQAHGSLLAEAEAEAAEATSGAQSIVAAAMKAKGRWSTAPSSGGFEITLCYDPTSKTIPYPSCLGYWTNNDDVAEGGVGETDPGLMDNTSAAAAATAAAGGDGGGGANGMAMRRRSRGGVRPSGGGGGADSLTKKVSALSGRRNSFLWSKLRDTVVVQQPKFRWLGIRSDVTMTKQVEVAALARAMAVYCGIKDHAVGAADEETAAAVAAPPPLLPSSNHISNEELQAVLDRKVSDQKLAEEAEKAMVRRPATASSMHSANKRMAAGWKMNNPPITKLRFRAQNIVGKLKAVTLLTSMKANVFQLPPGAGESVKEVQPSAKDSSSVPESAQTEPEP